MPYSLLDEPWIPVLTRDHDVETLPLRDVLHRAHDLVDLAVTTPASAAGLLRLLYIITARTTGLDEPLPADPWLDHQADWLEHGRLDPDAIEEYCARHANGFDLFHPTRPFLQEARLRAQTDEKSVNRLDPTRTDDSGPVWNSHTSAGHAPPIPAGDAAMWLLYHHLCGSGGGGGSRKLTPDGKGDHYMKAGPLRGRLSCYPLGATLAETLLLGLPRPSTAPALHTVDTAAWETDQLPDPTTAPPAVTWPAGLLLGRSMHALLLSPNDEHTAVTGCRLTWAHKQYFPEVVDPYTVRNYAKNSGGWYDRPADATRAVWRHVDALLADRDTHHRPTAITAMGDMPPTMLPRLRVRVYGVDQDRQAKNNQWITATTPPVLSMLDELDHTAAAGAAALRNAAEDTHTTLATAMRQAHTNMATPGRRPDWNAKTPWDQDIHALYWARAESVFWSHLERRDFATPYWVFVQLARTVVDEATAPALHHQQVAREIASVHRTLLAFAAKKHPPPDDGGEDEPKSRRRRKNTTRKEGATTHG